MTFTPGSELNEDDLTQKDIDDYNKRRQKEYDDYNNPKDPNTLEEELKKRAEPDPSSGIAEPDYTLDSLLYSIVAPKLPVLGGATSVGGFLNQLRKKITNPSTVLQLQDEEQPLLSEQTFGTESNYLTRIFGEVTPQGVEYLKTLMMQKKGGFSEENQKKIDKIQKDIRVNRPQGDQLDLFFGETDDFLMQQYANLRAKEGDPIPTKLSTAKARRQVTRKIKVSDLDLILQEFPDIPKDKANEYIQAIREEERGENIVAGSPRKGGNGKGLIGTLRWLNSVAMAPNSKTPSDINVQDVANELSAEFNKTITVKTLDNIIQEKGSIPVEIADKEVMQVTDLKSLIKAYVRRVERYNKIPAFEAGHVFAAKNIMEDFNIPKNEKLANYKGNLEPEIARSIYSMVDEEALTDLLKGSDLKTVQIGNRGRKDESDPDKVIAALYGRDYGLRESFLNFVYPERSLKNKVRDDLKSLFTDIYKEEMELALSDYDKRGGGGGTVSPRVLDVIRNRVLRDRVMPYFDEQGLQEVMEALTLTSDKISGRSQVADEDELLSRNLLRKQEIRRKGEMK